MLFAALSGVLFGAPGASASSAQCSPTRAIFYTSGDWLQLAQALAADASSCVEYYISIPPVTADKTEMQPDAASVVDALGPNFHAAAEVNYTAWANWVASTGNSWYAAGQAARASMDAAGFNVADGDTWAVNEFPSSVRSDAPGAREDVEQLVEGLYAGQGADRPAQGIVFMIGVGQNSVSFPEYTASLESWFQDTTFWSTMAADVSDFLFETYGDVRNYAVAGEDPATRIEFLNDYLQAPLALVSAPNAPATDAAARSFLASAYGPLANADWAYTSGYGWTEVSSAVMADYISAQTYAMRAYGAGSRIGFAWNPDNSEGLDASDFATDVTGLLDLLAGSIRKTAGGDPTQACEVTGCTAVLPGAAPETGWASFSSWVPTQAVFTTAPQPLTAGTASGPLSVELQTDGVPTTLPVPAAVTLTSSSQTGTFATAPDGPWVPSLTLTIEPGSGSASFYALDSTGGSPTFTANLVPPPPPAEVTSLTFAPENDRMHVEVRVVDAAGQPLEARVKLAILVGLATIAKTRAGTTAQGWLGVTTFPDLERGCYSVRVESVVASGYQWNGSSPTQTDCVTRLPAHVGSLVFTPEDGRMHVTLRVSSGSGQPLQARVGLALLVGSKTVATTVGETTAAGVLGLTAQPNLERGCYTVHVESLVSPGWAWDGASPMETDCVTTLPARIRLVSFGRRDGHLHVELAVADESGQPLQAEVQFALLRDSTTFAATGGLTGSDGSIGLTASGKVEPGCYTVRVASVTARGYAWNQASPTSSYCVP